MSNFDEMKANSISTHKNVQLYFARCPFKHSLPSSWAFFTVILEGDKLIKVHRTAIHFEVIRGKIGSSENSFWLLLTVIML